MNICIFVVILIFVVVIVDTIYMQYEIKDACHDIGAELEYNGNDNYCIFSNNYAKEVIFNCKGLFFNKQCTVIEILK